MTEEMIYSINDEIPTTLWKTYSAFANTVGGNIIITDFYDAKKTLLGLMRAAANKNIVSYDLIQDNNIKVEDNKITVYIPKAIREVKPVFVGTNIENGSYRRADGENRRCGIDEIREMIRDSKEESIDFETTDLFDINELSKMTVASYRTMFKYSNPESGWNSLDDIDFLQRIGAVRRVGANKKLELTKAGLIMFGFDYDIKNVFPRYHVKYSQGTRKYSKVIESDSGKWSGNIFDFFLDVSKSINILVSSSLGNDFNIYQIFGEAFINCVTNADFFVPGGLSISFENGTIKFENPGTMRRDMSNNNNRESDPRNAVMMNMFSKIGFSKVEGHGISEIMSICSKCGWKKPVYIEEFKPARVKLVFMENEKK